MEFPFEWVAAAAIETAAAALAVTVTIGPLAVPTMASAKGRFAKPAAIVFERGA